MHHRKFLDPTHKWRLDKRRFNCETELGSIPEILSGTDIEELLLGFKNRFGDKTKNMVKVMALLKKGQYCLT